MTDFVMPSLGADMVSGRLVEWLVKPGDAVRRGDVVAVVETAKGAIEIEVFQDGVVRDLVAAPGSTIPVGGLLARIGGAAAAAPPPVAGPRATPAARRAAETRGIALPGLRGSGVDGAICLADLPAAPEPTMRGGFDPAAMRAAIAAAMARSKREIPHYYLSQTVDVTDALARLDRVNAGRTPPGRILPAALLLRAAARAIAATPEVNGFWENGAFRPGDGVHLGWAVALRGGGLVAPAIRHADRLDHDALMAALRDLVARARGGGLRGSELTDPTITVTSLGDRGAESVLPVIHPPQVAIIGFGRIVERPWVVAGAVLPRRVVTVTLAGDHRATDGHRGGLLLARIESHLREAEAP